MNDSIETNANVSKLVWLPSEKIPSKNLSHGNTPTKTLDFPCFCWFIATPTRPLPREIPKDKWDRPYDLSQPRVEINDTKYKILLDLTSTPHSFLSKKYKTVTGLSCFFESKSEVERCSNCWNLGFVEIALGIENQKFLHVNQYRK